MAFWHRKKKKQNSLRAEENAQEQNLSQEVAEEMTGEEKRLSEKELAAERVVPKGKAEQKRFVQACLESIRECERQTEIARAEYGQVTEYLTDIQKIDRIAGEEREKLLELCKRIQRLLQERNQYKNRTLTITERQMRRFDRYQDELIDEIKKMYEQEAYQKALDGDLEKLHAEKKKIRKEKEDIVEKQHALKVMAKFLIALILSLFVLFVAIYFALETDMTFPYLATVLLAAISATVLLLNQIKTEET